MAEEIVVEAVAVEAVEAVTTAFTSHATTAASSVTSSGFADTGSGMKATTIVASTSRIEVAEAAEVAEVAAEGSTVTVEDFIISPATGSTAAITAMHRTATTKTPLHRRMVQAKDKDKSPVEAR